MQKNTLLAIIGGAAIGAASAAATVQEWYHLVPQTGTLASYAACIEKFQALDDDGAIARKSCKAQHVKELRYRETTSFKAAISKDFKSVRLWAEQGDGQDYERVVGTISVLEGGKTVDEHEFVATAVERHPGVELEGNIENSEAIRGLSWCREEEEEESCLEWGARRLYGLTHG